MLFNTYEPWKFAFSSQLSNLDDVQENSWGIIGVPFDSTTSYHSGARLGPVVVREASYGFEKYNTTFNTNLDTVFYDFGDANIVPGNCQETCRIVEDAVCELSGYNVKPIIIGGEHSATIGAVSALIKKYPKLTVVHMDAHRDLAFEFIGESFSHATVMRRIHEFGLNELVQIGIRSSSEEEEEFAKSHSNITTFKMSDVRRHIDAIEYYLANIKTPIYLSIDMDVFDPSYAPSVGNPTPSGIHIGDLEEIIQSICEKRVVGMDVVETATDRLGDITAVTASKIIYDFLSLL